MFIGTQMLLIDIFKIPAPSLRREASAHRSGKHKPGKEVHNLME